MLCRHAALGGQQATGGVPGWLGVGESPLPEPFGVLLIALSGSSAPRCLMLSLHSAHSEMGVCGLE